LGRRMVRFTLLLRLSSLSSKSFAFITKRAPDYSSAGVSSSSHSRIRTKPSDKSTTFFIPEFSFRGGKAAISQHLLLAPEKSATEHQGIAPPTRV